MDHCVYCGTPFPSGFRDGVPEPEALKWINRPSLPPEASKQLELMKVVPYGEVRRPRALALALAGFSVPVIGVVLYLIYSLLRRYSAPAAVVVLLGGAALLAYLLWRAANLPKR
jgi:hypothetical protein